jgi:SAM-dependent methyltransferase
MNVPVEGRHNNPQSCDAEADRGSPKGSEAFARRPEFYEQYWEDVDHHFEYNFEAAVQHRFPSICRVWGSLRAPGRMLDWGCGNGVLTYWMYENGFGSEVLGVDVSQTAVAYANKRFARTRLSFRQLAPGTSTQELGRFDALVCSHVLEHLDDPIAALRDLRGLAEWYVIEVPLESALVTNFLAARRGGSRSDNSVGHVQFWNREGFRAVVAAAGYYVVRDNLYASSPFCRYVGARKRSPQRALLALVGTDIYSRFMAVNYTVLARVK